MSRVPGTRSVPRADRGSRAGSPRGGGCDQVIITLKARKKVARGKRRFGAPPVDQVLLLFPSPFRGRHTIGTIYRGRVLEADEGGIVFQQ